MSMEFIANGLVEMVAGLTSAAVLAGYSWWAPPVLAGAWLATHWLLRESGVWRDRNTEEVRAASRHSEYAYRLAVEPQAAKEVRLFGLADWVVERFRSTRKRLFELRWEATRLRERSVTLSLIVVLGANIAVFWSIAIAAVDGTMTLERVVTYASVALTTSMIAFGGLSWALDGAAAPVAAVLRLEGAMELAGALAAGDHSATGMPAREIRFRNVRFAYPEMEEPVLDGFDLTIPAGSSLAIVGQNGAGKTTLAKLLCRLYDPQSGGIEVDGIDLRALDVGGWRSRVTAVFQDFIRFELPMRENVAPGVRRMPSFDDRSRKLVRPNWPNWTQCWPAGTRGAPSFREDNGSAWRWRGRFVPSKAARALCCSMSRRRSSTCEERPRSSTGFWLLRGEARRS